MTRGRKQLGPSEKVHADVDTAAVKRDMNAVDQMHAQAKEILQDQQARATDEAVRLGMQLGAFQFARMQEKFLRAAQIHLFDEIRKSNAYKDLPIRHPDGSVRAADNIDEFCKVYLGVSYSKAHEESQLLATLGDACYEAAKSIGLKRDQLRLIRSLPVDTQESVKELLTSGGHGPELAVAVESLIVRLGSEKAAAEQERARLGQSIEAKDRLIRAKDEKLNELQMQLDHKASPDEKEKQQLEDIRSKGIAFEAAARIFIGTVGRVHADPVNRTVKLAAAQSVDYMCQVFARLIEEANLPVDFQNEVHPPWSLAS